MMINYNFILACVPVHTGTWLLSVCLGFVHFCSAFRYLVLLLLQIISIN